MRWRTGITFANVCIQASKREVDRRVLEHRSRYHRPMQPWPAPPADSPMPGAGEVVAVFADLAVRPDRLRRLTAGFNARERQRADSFATDEQQRLFARSPVEREQAFFRLWTCKEAFLKVTGEGLSRSTRSYEVELGRDGARLLWATGIADAARRYSVYPLDPGNGYAAALFAEAQGLTLRRFRWP